MSFIKTYQLKEKFESLIDFFHEFVLVKRSLHVIIASLIFSLLIIQFSTPEFYVASTLREAESSDQQSISAGGLASEILLGRTDSDSGNFGTFKANMHSYALAQRMWEQGWGSKVFGNGDEDIEYFNTIPKRHSALDRISAFLLGYELFQFYSAHDLQSYIKGNYKLDKTRGEENITVFTMTPDKEFAISFMNAVILETDKYAKTRLIQKSKEVISASYKQLSSSRNSSISSALATTINSEYFKIANLENDMPYHIYIIDPPHSSEYPISPNFIAIIFSNLIIFLFLSILFLFVKKNKEDLW